MVSLISPNFLFLLFLVCTPPVDAFLVSSGAFLDALLSSVADEPFLSSVDDEVFLSSVADELLISS